MTFKRLCVMPIRTTGCQMQDVFLQVTASRNMGFDFVLMSYGYLKNETIPSVDQHQVRILLTRTMDKRASDRCKRCYFFS